MVSVFHALTSALQVFTLTNVMDPLWHLQRMTAKVAPANPHHPTLSTSMVIDAIGNVIQVFMKTLVEQHAYKRAKEIATWGNFWKNLHTQPMQCVWSVHRHARLTQTEYSYRMEIEMTLAANLAYKEVILQTLVLHAPYVMKIGVAPLQMMSLTGKPSQRALMKATRNVSHATTQSIPITNSRDMVGTPANINVMQGCAKYRDAVTGMILLRVTWFLQI
jgi:hypothetical protein